jgi:acyl-CoA thioesterase
MACVLQAMGKVVEQLDPLTLTTHFLRPGLGDTEAVIDVDLVKPGRTLSTVTATMEQLGKPTLTMVAGFGSAPSTDGDGAAASSAAVTVEMPRVPPPSSCIDRAELAQGVDLPLLDRVDVRVLPELAESDPSKAAAMAGWIRFGDQRPPDTRSLPLFADAFPPSVFTRFGNIGWVPTLEMTVHVRRRPVDGWIFASFTCDDLADGFMIETGSLWDEAGSLVARSRQLGLLLPRSDG